MLAVLAVVILAGPAAQAASAVLGVVVRVLEVAGIVVAAAVVLGLAGWAASAVLRARERREIETAARPQYQLTVVPLAVRAVAAPSRAAIEASRPSLAEIESWPQSTAPT